MEGKNVKKKKKPKMGITIVSQLVVLENLFPHFVTINFLFFSLPSTVCNLLISVPPPTQSQTSLQELNQMHLMAKSEMQLTFGPHTHFSPPSLVTWLLESNFGRSWQNSSSKLSHSLSIQQAHSCLGPLNDFIYVFGLILYLSECCDGFFLCVCLYLSPIYWGQ